MDTKTSSMPETEAMTQQPATRVLVVEDNRDLAKLFCDLLEVMGCKTEAAFNARAALESAEANTPDLVFCDLRLPGAMNGFELAEHMRADPRFVDVPMIAVSGYADGPDRERALEAGFIRVFDKPVKFAQMMDVLKECRKT